MLTFNTVTKVVAEKTQTANAPRRALQCILIEANRPKSLNVLLFRSWVFFLGTFNFSDDLPLLKTLEGGPECGAFVRVVFSYFSDDFIKL